MFYNIVSWSFPAHSCKLSKYEKWSVIKNLSPWYDYPLATPGHWVVPVKEWRAGGEWWEIILDTSHNIQGTL